MADFPLDEIAKHAGMEVGTLYRRFPTREALWVANINSHLLAPR
ncbi:TetR family transcriptional regulator [Stenotrophomonas riyadhensis]